jgi:hypothetical protein
MITQLRHNFLGGRFIILDYQNFGHLYTLLTPLQLSLVFGWHNKTINAVRK